MVEGWAISSYIPFLSSGQQKGPGFLRGLLMPERRRELHADYVSGLQAFRAFDQFKSYAIAFSEGFEAVSRDCGEVNEYIIATFLLKKPKTLAVIKPFYSSVYHVRLSPDTSL